ncbi:hypothetical protein [Thermoanaerobacterium sp. R66]|uniref:hypothetical protein n=1 Tax=Thermoanaerobacterium sp. R66 TaxID=2742479 RepID=UPI0023809A18|nr:hypothetical protein [Thermoanaerobacterium sp. R66]MDE4541240.1 hypothetical protein [Thermoanaerobacterium sp. R66]
MLICPNCFEIFPELWPIPCPKCKTKAVPTDLSIIGVVERLIKLGFNVSYSCCYTDDENVGKTTKIRIEFTKNYPPTLFQDLPYDWFVYEDVDIASETYKRFTALGCAYWHPRKIAAMMWLTLTAELL